MDRTQELLLEFRRLCGKYGLIRADAERIIDEMREAGGRRVTQASAHFWDHAARYDGLDGSEERLWRTAMPTLRRI
jgi:hypothetical protein